MLTHANIDCVYEGEDEVSLTTHCQGTKCTKLDVRKYHACLLIEGGRGRERESEVFFPQKREKLRGHSSFISLMKQTVATFST